jgi:uncharacterized membrane protein
MARFILGLAVFFGVHSISMLALGWRNRMVDRLGTRSWQAIYSVVALAGAYLIVTGYGEARLTAPVLYTPPAELRYLTAILMLPVFTLALASVFSGRIRARAQHPLLLSAMLWAVAHLLANGGLADLLLFGGFLAWAIAVRASLARRPARRMIALAASPANDLIAVVGGLALYAAFVLWLHARWFGVPALPAM